MPKSIAKLNNFFILWYPLIVETANLILWLYPIVLIIYTIIMGDYSVFHMNEPGNTSNPTNPADEHRDTVNYFQTDLATLKTIYKQCGLDRADHLLSPEELEEKKDLLEQIKDGEQAVRHHIAEVRIHTSQDSTAESSNTQSSKRTFSAVSDQAADTEKTKRTR